VPRLLVSRERLLNLLEKSWKALRDSYEGMPDRALLEPGVVGHWSGLLPISRPRRRPPDGLIPDGEGATGGRETIVLWRDNCSCTATGRGGATGETQTYSFGTG
jgi:hypothetical protein